MEILTHTLKEAVVEELTPILVPVSRHSTTSLLTRKSRGTILIDEPVIFPQELLDSLPDGITFVGKSEYENKNPEDIVRVGQFVVNVSECSVQGLKKCRQCFPKNDYRLIKNRKTARD